MAEILPKTGIPGDFSYSVRVRDDFILNFLFREGIKIIFLLKLLFKKGTWIR